LGKEENGRKWKKGEGNIGGKGGGGEECEVGNIRIIIVVDF
jgi:hypothetical protein